MKISLVTTLLPKFTFMEIAEFASSIGYEGLEIRIKDLNNREKNSKYSFWGNHKGNIGVRDLINKAKYIRDICIKRKLQICMLATYLKINDFEAIEKVCESTKELGCNKIRLWAPVYTREQNYNILYKITVKELEKVEKIAKKYSIQFALEIHHGTIIPSAGLAFRLVSKFNPKYIGLIYDPGNMVFEGFENYKLGLQLIKSYITHVHIKNSKWVLKKNRKKGIYIWNPIFTGINKGIVNFKQFFKDLKSIKYKDWVSNEDFNNCKDKSYLKKDYIYMKKLMQ